jgi:hypothetical protein
LVAENRILQTKATKILKYRGRQEDWFTSLEIDSVTGTIPLRKFSPPLRLNNEGEVVFTATFSRWLYFRVETAIGFGAPVLKASPFLPGAISFAEAASIRSI